MAHPLILALALACARPPVERWTGCLNEGATLELDPRYGVVRAVDGPGAVLRIGTRWGGLPLVTDHHQTASLWIELPAPVAVGSHALTEGEAWYRELYRELPQVDGTVSIVELGPAHAVVAVDVTLPSEVGVPPIVGRVVVRRERGHRCWVR